MVNYVLHVTDIAKWRPYTTLTLMIMEKGQYCPLVTYIQDIKLSYLLNFYTDAELHTACGRVMKALRLVIAHTFMIILYF